MEPNYWSPNRLSPRKLNARFSSPPAWVLISKLFGLKLRNTNGDNNLAIRAPLSWIKNSTYYKLRPEARAARPIKAVITRFL